MEADLKVAMFDESVTNKIRELASSALKTWLKKVGDDKSDNQWYIEKCLRQVMAHSDYVGINTADTFHDFKKCNINYVDIADNVVGVESANTPYYLVIFNIDDSRYVARFSLAGGAMVDERMDLGDD